MVIQHNLMALNASRQFGINTISRAKTAEKLGSGYRVNRSADDAAGLAISEKMRRQIRGLTQASRNAQDGISMVQTAEGALNETHDMLQRMNELCIQAANDTMTYDDRAYIQMEIRHTMDEIDRFGETVTFNGIKLFDGLLQTKCTAVAGGVSINGSSGAVTQATETQNAFCRMKPLSSGDDIELTGTDGTKEYYKVATRDEILAYRQEWADYYVQKAKYDRGEITDEPTEPALYDGSGPGKGELTEVEDLLPKIAANLGKYNANKNADVAQSVTTSYSYSNDGRFELRFNGPLPVMLQVGAESGQYIRFEINAINSATLGLEDLNVRGDDNEGAEEGIEKIKDAISVVSKERSKLGSVQNRLEHTIRNLDNVVENTTQAESQIRDTDMAREMVSYSIRNILMQAGYTVMSQANASNSAVLSLVG